MKKIYNSAAEALDGVLFDGMLIAAGGFGLCGIPENLIEAIRDSGVRNLTVASNNAGVDDFGLGVHKEFDGETYILERGIVADLAIVKAWKADDTGNLVFRKTARNFNPPAAMCGRICIAEVEEIVTRGALDPDGIHLPGIYVHRMIQGEHEKRIEQRTTRAA